ncbi:MAG TPA: type II secretion system protein GspG [Planctomicrobium sp.]|nr:type II secretion system protein GspG [Planctomicrobium sp.]
MRRRQQPTSASLLHTRLGFTLIEILLVLVIISVIAAMAVPRLLGQQQAAYIKNTKIAIADLEKNVELWAVGNQGVYPPSIQSLLQKSEDGTSAIYDKIPADSWQTPLNYEYPNTKASSERPAIWSSGPNRQNENGGGDDINNWADLAI